MLSAYALLGTQRATTVLTVFAGHLAAPLQGPWDALCGFPTSEAGARARRAEDAAAMSGLPHELRYLDLLEGQYVHGRGASESAVVAAAVRGWLAEGPGPATLALPAGAGRRRSQGWRGRLGRLRVVERAGRLLERLSRRSRGPLTNEDHLFVRDAVLDAVAPSALAEILLYEEVPYGWGGPADASADDAARAWGARATPIRVPVDRAAKAARVACYASQLAQVRGPEGDLGVPEGLPQVERYWRLRAPSGSRASSP